MGVEREKKKYAHNYFFFLNRDVFKKKSGPIKYQTYFLYDDWFQVNQSNYRLHLTV